MFVQSASLSFSFIFLSYPPFPHGTRALLFITAMIFARPRIHFFCISLRAFHSPQFSVPCFMHLPVFKFAPDLCCNVFVVITSSMKVILTISVLKQSNVLLALSRLCWSSPTTTLSDTSKASLTLELENLLGFSIAFGSGHWIFSGHVTRFQERLFFTTLCCSQLHKTFLKVEDTYCQ